MHIFESPIYIICNAKSFISFNENFDKRGFCLFETFFYRKIVCSEIQPQNYSQSLVFAMQNHPTSLLAFFQIEKIIVLIFYLFLQNLNVITFVYRKNMFWKCIPKTQVNRESSNAKSSNLFNENNIGFCLLYACFSRFEKMNYSYFK